jgi:alpha-methylacyl-CoA racemase
MGPLEGVTVLEVGGIGPVPFCGMLLADMGARVIRIDRPGTRKDAGGFGVLDRGRDRIELNLKHAEHVAQVLALLEGASALIEGFRPGVMERLGLGPEECFARNPALVYGRMTGWGQEGPLAQAAGHDINYIAIAGVLHAIGSADGLPVPPLNLVADFGGGGMMLAVGVLGALIAARATGQGRVIDAAMVDGASLLMTMVHGMRSAGAWSSQRGVNMLDGGAPFYGVYRCADDKFLAVGAVEPQFYASFVAGLGLAEEAEAQWDRARWAISRQRIADVVAGRSRDEWVKHFRDRDACVSPVLDLEEAVTHEHAVARRAFVEIDGTLLPRSAPRFSSVGSRVPGTRVSE